MDTIKIAENINRHRRLFLGARRDGCGRAARHDRSCGSTARQDRRQACPPSSRGRTRRSVR